MFYIDGDVTNGTRAHYGIVRMLESFTRDLRTEMEEMDRAAQAYHESQRLRAYLEPRRDVRQVYAIWHTKPPKHLIRRARSNPPARFAFYQGNF